MAPTISSSSRGKSDDDKGRGAGRSGDKRSDLISRVKYTNTLPDIPFDPKFIQYPFDPLRFVTYKETSLEKTYKWELHTEHDLGVTIDLVDPYTYAIPANPHPHATDEKILEEESSLAGPTESKRSKLHQMPASWLRKTEYMSAENFRTGQASASAEKSETRIGYRIRKQMDEHGGDIYKDREAQIETITKTFEVAKETITQHYSKPGVTPVEVLPVFPDFQMWGLPCAQVIFDSDPAPQGKPQSEAEDEMCEAIIRGMMDDTGEQFVAYFLPMDECKEKRKRDVESGVAYDPDTEYEYRLAREYNWTVKHKGTRGYEQSYFFIMRPDGMYYNELETRVRLSRRKMDVGKKAAASNTKLILKHRTFNPTEQHMQEVRMSQLEPVMEEVEEEEEDEEEGEEDNGKDSEGEGEKDSGGEEGKESRGEEEKDMEGQERKESGGENGNDSGGEDDKGSPVQSDNEGGKERKNIRESSSETDSD